ncbi:hypothetical protein GUITHDRAFT_153582 [Guillardia theta CCMP2712]|uniref:Ubiquitin-like protease family profile domain-containing protein n=2 Tax=Guillardia theta TaxID=55529 RepID=L1J2L0_GUITC|nr:hypothetical protein GUITHDRAFT_153582 [Guillardia theta CCMP2712]EKX42315.1 hypothetical protein GUITHDRAFT_153582 [Guillardia theta CCMP2712]|eukprot:XP_005829295.1 hypothetical protein GUITHDRAFT_153582 [Guillardia theta CCMP2712]
MGNFAITAKELKCLLDNSWLNDEIINSYMALLRLRSKIHEGLNDTSFPRCEFFSSFFYAILRNAKGGYSYKNVERWGRRKNFLECDHILFPINVSNMHWCLAVVSPRDLKIEYYDSMGGENKTCVDLLERYMQDEGAYRKIEHFQSSWNKFFRGPPDVPEQKDGSGCGVFACAFADCISAGKDVKSFEQNNVSSIRRCMSSLIQSCDM